MTIHQDLNISGDITKTGPFLSGYFNLITLVLKYSFSPDNLII
jgi:hypothetical protein